MVVVALDDDDDDDDVQYIFCLLCYNKKQKINERRYVE